MSFVSFCPQTCLSVIPIEEPPEHPHANKIDHREHGLHVITRPSEHVLKQVLVEQKPHVSVSFLVILTIVYPCGCIEPLTVGHEPSQPRRTHSEPVNPSLPQASFYPSEFSNIHVLFPLFQVPCPALQGRNMLLTARASPGIPSCSHIPPRPRCSSARSPLPCAAPSRSVPRSRTRSVCPALSATCQGGT